MLVPYTVYFPGLAACMYKLTRQLIAPFGILYSGLNTTPRVYSSQASHCWPLEKTSSQKTWVCTLVHIVEGITAVRINSNYYRRPDCLKLMLPHESGKWTSCPNLG